MDTTDKEILKILQEDAKLSISELGRTIGLSTTATKERVRKLEQEGIIKGYTAVLNAGAVEAGLLSYISIPLGEISITEMGDRLVAMPEVLECHKVTGNTCFLIKVRTSSTAELESVIESINDFARNTYTYVALSTLKETSKLKIV
jgi:Lrp/AsnC family leucine-responsive transcriptional regulator